jgi:hypothetical protein
MGGLVARWVAKQGDGWLRREKKKTKFSSYIRKFRCKVIYGDGLPNIGGNAQIFNQI